MPEPQKVMLKSLTAQKMTASLYTLKKILDTEMQEVFNEIISMRRSLNESISFPPVRTPNNTP